jgi:hypothetical protein
MAQRVHSARFPGESSRYRTARNRLLAAEVALRREVQHVARMRRKLALGGKVPEDYLFDEPPSDSSNSGTGRQVRLSNRPRSGVRAASGLAQATAIVLSQQHLQS